MWGVFNGIYDLCYQKFVMMVILEKRYRMQFLQEVHSIKVVAKYEYVCIECFVCSTTINDQCDPTLKIFKDLAIWQLFKLEGVAKDS